MPPAVVFAWFPARPAGPGARGRFLRKVNFQFVSGGGMLYTCLSLYADRNSKSRQDWLVPNMFPHDRTMRRGLGCRFQSSKR